MPATTEIEVKARKADVAATMTATTPRPVPATVTAVMSAIRRAATVGCGAPAIHRMTMTVITGNDLLAIHRAAAGAAAMREAAGASVAVRVVCLAGGGDHHGKTSAEGQESDELFHDLRISMFGLAPQSVRHGVRRGLPLAIQPRGNLFHIRTTMDCRSPCI